ncbi:phosphoribosyl-AMP cyclohydrolase [bacterium]|nr:phosphoribosyl-AMP cyclohydrolase [bacterium]
MSPEKLLKEVDFSKLNGLIPAVTQDKKTKEILMLGFMNKEALEKTLQEKRVTYFSRTRNSLWTKGETSGNVQAVKEISLDCDNDSLLIKVKQKGNVCHTGKSTCFFKEVLEK